MPWLNASSSPQNVRNRALVWEHSLTGQKDCWIWHFLLHTQMSKIVSNPRSFWTKVRMTNLLNCSMLLEHPLKFIRLTYWKSPFYLRTPMPYIPHWFWTVGRCVRPCDSYVCSLYSDPLYSAHLLACLLNCFATELCCMDEHYAENVRAIDKKGVPP